MYNNNNDDDNNVYYHIYLVIETNEISHTIYYIIVFQKTVQRIELKISVKKIGTQTPMYTHNKLEQTTVFVTI